MISSHNLKIKKVEEEIITNLPRYHRKLRSLPKHILITFFFFILGFQILKFFLISVYFSHERSFSIDTEKGIFIKDGEPFRYISGSLHYFRIPRIYWKDRLLKAKISGLDAIQIYIPWNIHEPNPEEYVFYDERNVFEFISMAHEVGLLVLVRAGPYICAEWDFGGLPAWLLSENPNVIIRSSDPDFLHPTIRWFSHLLPQLKPLLYNNGGPIIMVQLENEYGSFPACDGKYLSALYTYTRFELGSEIILYTTDGPGKNFLKCGSSDRHLLATVDFGISGTDNLTKTFGDLEAFQPKHPLVNSEFYSGWFDHWGEKRHVVDAHNLTIAAERMLNYSSRLSFNIYMFHGGTNFGYWNGASNASRWIISSYDYDAPVSESGDITNKFVMLQETFFKFKGETPPPLPPNISKAAYGTATLRSHSHLLYKLRGGIQKDRPLTMEAMKQYHGFMVYTTSIVAAHDSNVLQFEKVKDVGHVFTGNIFLTDFVYQGSVRGSGNLSINVDPSHSTLAVITECQGHTNFGEGMIGDVKGIIGKVSLNSKELLKWTMVAIDARNSNPIPSSKGTPNVTFPHVGKIFQGTFNVSTGTGSPKDTFAKMTGFTRGVLIINDAIVGRYEPLAGPQVTLYVPANFLRPGENVVKVLEMENLVGKCRTTGSHCSVSFLNAMVWQ